MIYSIRKSEANLLFSVAIHFFFKYHFLGFITLWILFRTFFNDYMKWIFLEKLLLATSKGYSILIFEIDRRTIFGDGGDFFM